MNRVTLVTLVATTKARLAQTEAKIRQLLGAMAALGEIFDMPEANRKLEALQQERIERLLEVQGLQDEIAALREE